MGTAGFWRLPQGADSSQSYNPRLDLVLFVNGIPVATLELKSEFKQSVENAKRQYRYDRPVKDPLTRKPEPLLTFKRGALVHFAVSQDEVAMTTKLAGKETFFLFPKRVLDTVLDAMTDHEKLSLEVLDNEIKSRAFAMVILKMLTAAGGLGQGNSGAAV